MSKETSKIIPSEQSVLYIDVGNSSIKVVVHDGVWDTVERFTHSEISTLIDWINTKAGAVERIILSSVVEKATRDIAEYVQDVSLLTLATGDIPRELLDYDTPGTLGIDRYLACYGAMALQHNSVVVIDAGTACTIDYMSAEGVFHGGIIMPGISAIEHAVKLHAPALPEVARAIPHKWPGKSTKASLQWGLTGALADSIQATLSRYREVFGLFDLVLTGGDAPWLSSLIQREVKIEPLLVFKGMKRFVENLKSE